MSHKLYRDKTEAGYEDVELDLDQELIDWLEDRAIVDNTTVDEVVENILREAIEKEFGAEEAP